MIGLLIVAIVTVLAVELFVRLPFRETVKTFGILAGKAYFTIRAASVSDRWKELVLPRYSLLMMQCSLRLLGFVLIVAAFVLVSDFVTGLFGVSAIDALSTWSGVATSLGVSGLYVLARNRIAA